ncbi:MAG: tRNA threonylcarbamoyladenosine biosynthesis protein TsaB, partial [Actinomycetota bacterium]|nr:tRNA threonylcarbamoyladenosine biosynthesis protein TsaB [Actinomycetota bacterium]
MTMLLLAIDTSSAAVTAALHDGRRVLGRAETLDARGHAEHLTPMIDSALAQAGAAPGDLTAVAVGVGPGPFTGLRVGLVTGKVLALTLGVPVHGLCSLDALAHGALAGADPDVAGPDVAGPDVAGPDVADPEGTDPDVADPEGTDPDVADP